MCTASLDIEPGVVIHIPRTSIVLYILLYWDYVTCSHLRVCVANDSREQVSPDADSSGNCRNRDLWWPCARSSRNQDVDAIMVHLESVSVSSRKRKDKISAELRPTSLTSVGSRWNKRVACQIKNSSCKHTWSWPMSWSMKILSAPQMQKRRN